MASAVEPVIQTSTAGCFAKVHDVFSMACSGNEKQVIDALSSAPNTYAAFSSFKRPGESSAAPDSKRDADRANTFPGITNSESTDGSEPMQNDGPSTPMRYLAKPKHVHIETPDSAISLPSLSLGTVSHFVDKEDMSKQENAEFNKVESPSDCLTNVVKELQSISKPGTSNDPGAPGTLSAFAMSMPAGLEIQQPNLHKHMAVLTQSHVPQSCSSVSSAFSLQSSKVIPEKINPAKASAFHMNTKQQIVFNNSQQSPETTMYPPVTPVSVNGVPFNFSQGLQCEDIIQGSAARQKFRTPACISNQFSNSIPSSRLEAVNYMPLLQTSLMAAGLGDQQTPTSEDLLSLSNQNNQPFAKKRKLACQKHPVVHSVGEAAVEMNRCALETRQGAAKVENHQLEARGQHPYRQVKRFRSPSDKVEIVKSVNGFADFQNMNSFGKLRHLAESVAMKSSVGGATSASPICGPYSLGSKMQNPSCSERGKTPISLSLEAEKAATFSNQSRGNTEGQSSDNRSHPLGLRLLTFPAYAPMPAAVSTFSSGGPSLPQYIKNQGNGGDSHLVTRHIPKRTLPELEWGKFLALSATPDYSVGVEETETETLLPYQKRFMQLQAFLKQCDEPNQKYLKSIRNLSAAARSGHAVELETRAIMLSLEEGKEITRMKVLNVFAKSFPNGANEE
ncbi:hypothetical protein KI387_037118, partial [Taxus chinensis]